MVKRSRVLGCGSYLPANVVTNRDLEARVDTSDEWIVQRTGIKSRHIAADGELTSDLAIAAATRALEHAGVDAASIDCIVLATTTPDNTFPATATKVQAALGTKGFALDIQAVCAGFVYAMSIADNFIRIGQANRALVIGAETFSRLLDWKDRTTCVLFGDGAGAVVMDGYDAAGTSADRGVLSTHLHSDGAQYGLLYVDGGPSTTGTAGHVRMNGQDVFRHAVSKLSSVVEEALAANGLEPSAVDWLVPHQANQRIIDGIARKLKLPSDKVVLTVDRHGNTSAASIPLALCEAVHDGRVKRGDLILMEAIGGGLTWGAAMVRW
ncbi:ketoacyl-ACP synthase III [Azospirillum brasilense]|uniref:Beta-ketoacyl-[acyl-carrier-protein] synthase III n=3 Tax=Azospirillum TaxID=191 RepID=A0A560C8V5_AZOBR|nr:MULTISPECIES: beta-ketoacyl-ACP synthase III [Azospirillum]AIB11562.1 3-oxoacyl-ACP synthase [Azospirillum argentinense]ALJ35413.1 3-oxoacyl-ACP synthase [Azospirillum brasilense]AWJ89712.1 ketoacyl-ACP synthase III [Azospirillum baldaniorum]EZQ08474.1 3-oxoacyl-ACP synthase [Azospirillum argentinense]KAA1058889.1 3-oxoacyl-[acyl-carrier-protein] synthase, KASIII [Azospirillum argentinense]